MQTPKFEDCINEIKTTNHQIEETKEGIRNDLERWISRHPWEGDKAYDDR